MGQRHLTNILVHGKEWGVDVVYGYDSSSLAFQTASRLVGELAQAGGCSTRCSLASGGAWEPDHQSTVFNAAIISTPPEHHFEYAAKLPNTHLLVEKPVAEADWDNLPENGRLVLAAMNYRFHPAAAVLQEDVGRWDHRLFISYTSTQAIGSYETLMGPTLSNLHCLDLVDYIVGRIRSIRADGNLAHLDVPALHEGAQILTCLTEDGPRSLQIVTGHTSYLGVGRGIEYQIIQKPNGDIQYWQYDLELMYIDELAEFFARCQGKRSSRLPTVREVYRLVKMVGPYKP